MLNPILIIGGSKRYRPLFAALKDLGIEIKQVPSAQEGVAALDLKPYDAVVMEWDLSFSNPLEIVERIKKTRPKVPVLALGSGPEPLAERLCRSENRMAPCFLKHFAGPETIYMAQTMREMNSGCGFYASTDNIRQLYRLLPHICITFLEIHKSLILCIVSTADRPASPF